MQGARHARGRLTSESLLLVGFWLTRNLFIVDAPPCIDSLVENVDDPGGATTGRPPGGVHRRCRAWCVERSRISILRWAKIFPIRARGSENVSAVALVFQGLSDVGPRRRTRFGLRAGPARRTCLDEQHA